MSIRKMTFSLASLILIFALAAIPAMAHDTAPEVDGIQHGDPASTPTTIGTHTHADAPTVESIELVGIMVGTASTVDGMQVKLVDDADGATPALADGATAAGQFVVKITFSEDVYNGTSIAIPTVPATAAADDLVTAELTLTAAAEAASAVDLITTAVNPITVAALQHQVTGQTVPTIAAAIDADTADHSVFWVTFEVPSERFGGEDADASDLPIDIWISVNADAVYTATGLDSQGQTVYGTGNTASMREKFTIVSEFETPIPTVMIEAAAGATVDAPFTATLTFSDPVTVPTVEVTGGVAGTPAPATAGDTMSMVWTVEITPVLNATEVTVDVPDTTGTGTAASVTATTDSTDPTVVIAMGASGQSGRTLPITITIADDVALAAGAAIDEATEVTVAGGTLGTLTRAGDVYSGDVTINYDTTSVTVTVAAGAVADTSDNMSAAAAMTFSGLTPTATPTAAMLKAGEYIVIVRDKMNPPPFGNLTPKLASWSEVSDEEKMPDLERLFDIGGTVNVKVTGATPLQVVFSEVMWAVDQGNVDDRAAYLGEQWIELHNRTSGANAKDFALSAIKISSKEGRPALAEETDRISNVVGAGDDWVLGKGQNGNSGAADGSGRVEFISMYRDNKDKPGQQYEAGHQSASWTKSSELYATNHRGTPGQIERAGVPIIKTTNANRGPVIFNEIANHTNPDYEWIEIKNVSGGNVNLKNYEVTITTAVGTDNDLIDFTGADRNVPAGGILLVVKKDPTGDPNHPLAAGWNFGARNTWTPAKPGEANWVRGVNENSARYMVASTFNAMPDDGNFVLILRDEHGRNGSTDHDNIRDVAGYHSNLKVDDGTRFTNLWPLSNFPAPNWTNNKLAAGTVQRRQHAGIDGTKSTDKNQNDKTAFRDDDNGWSGIGYKRSAAANAQNGGTPGHPFSAHARHNRFDETTRSSVIVSEVMPAQGPRDLPEWIELLNTSATESVSVEKWRITITNHDKDSADGADGSFAGDLSISFTLGAHVIPPNQPYLIVARHGRDKTKLPDERIHSVGRRAGQLLLNPYGFQIKVEAWEKDNVYHAVETVGNLGAAPTNNRRPDAQSFQAVAWDLPATVNADNVRVSLVRVPDTGAAKGVVDGMKQGAWKLFDMSNQIGKTLDDTYYGHSSDLGSPGHSVGGVLPVSLSKFRPERLKDTGEIVVRWITESELNNAGFNILRSETRDGEFTKVHFVAGQGTTSERTLYEWKDKTAKPNVVYYYQIQDVSLDGEVSVLATTHLRGNVSAAGKLTTTWGELKALQ